jgi:hypothetical protein
MQLQVVKFVLILSFNLHVGVPSDLFSSGFLTAILHAFHISPIIDTSFVNVALLYYIGLKIGISEGRYKL